MDKSFRRDMLSKIHPDAQKASIVGSLEREYTLNDVAIMTRAGPAKSLGLKDRGHLGAGACADITVYEDNPDREAMFQTPVFVFKNGELVVRNGKVVKVTAGATHVARPSYDKSIEKSLKAYFETYHTVRMENFRVSDEEIVASNCGHTGGACGCVIVQPTGARLA
jgi:formylmethanofuran dehydrogenase subunit A